MNFDKDLFIEDLRRRLKRLISYKGFTGAGLSKAAGQNTSRLRDFLNGRSEDVYLSALIEWTQVLDVNIATLVDGIGLDLEDQPDPQQETTEIGQERSALSLRDRIIGRNLRYWRLVLRKPQKDVAAILGVQPQDIANYEAGLKSLDAQQIINIADEFGLQHTDISPRNI